LYVIAQLIFLGTGKWLREEEKYCLKFRIQYLVEIFSHILLKVSTKFCEIAERLSKDNYQRKESFQIIEYEFQII